MNRAPYGAWKSPVSAQHLVKDAVVFQEIAHEGKNLYWSELVPALKGRVRLMGFDPEGKLIDFAPEMTLRTRVHEYGGGALHAHNGSIYFVNSVDGRIYRLTEKGPTPITPASNLRLADPSLTPDGRTLYAVAEEHKDAGVVENKIVKFKAGAQATTVASGHDFYSSPRVSPDGKSIAWITWDHPQMPWDGSNLWLAQLEEDDSAPSPILVAGGKKESICNIKWSKSGELYFVSDRTGWWNLYKQTKNGKIEALYPAEADFALPPWIFGRESYGFTANGELVCIYTKEGVDHLAVYAPAQKELEEIPLPFTMIRNLCVEKEHAYFQAGSGIQPPSLIELNLQTKKFKILKESMAHGLDKKWISQPQAIAFTTRNKDVSHGFYYPPKNPNFQAPSGELPPLIVKCHGGPTGHTQPVFLMETQFWTSRGFAFLDMNYSGSSGYGKAYRDRLLGNWGIRDVEDCLDAALYLVNQKLADPNKLMIRGGSAGGYTTLAALTFHDLFAAGASYYGVSDLELLAKDTHKFESHYLDQLVAPYPAGKEIYYARSPLHHMSNLKKPLLLLQGSDDPIVPLNQAQLVFDTLKKNGTTVSLLVFNGEQHGFKMAPTIIKAIEAELYFYAKVLKLDLPEKIDPIPIEHLEH